MGHHQSRVMNQHQDCGQNRDAGVFDLKNRKQQLLESQENKYHVTNYC